MDNIILMLDAPFLVGGARAFIGAQKVPELSHFLLPLALISAWVGACILLDGVHAGVVVVDINSVGMFIIVFESVGCRHWGNTGSYDFWFLVGCHHQPEV